jgi:hypothetical protein
MKHVIRWTTHEKDILVAEAVKLVQNNNYKLLDAFRQAQNAVLEPDRHRNLSTLQILGDLVKTAKHELNKPFVYDQVNAKPVQQEPVVKDASLDTLVHCIAEYIANTVKSEIKKVVIELEHEFSLKRHNPEMQSTRRIAKPWISVIGLLPHQEQSISKEFPEYDFHFMPTEYAIHAKPIDADAHLLMKNFIKHSIYSKYRDNPRHVLIDGGLTTLRNWLSTEGKKL